MKHYCTESRSAVWNVDPLSGMWIMQISGT